MKIRWIFRLKILNSEKGNSKSNVFFRTHFSIDFGKVRGGFQGFWEGFGGSWRLLGHFLASFFEPCIQNVLQKGSWRLLGSILAPFRKVWEGSGEGFGKVLGAEINVFLISLFWGRIFGLRVLVGGASGLHFDVLFK